MTTKKKKKEIPMTPTVTDKKKVIVEKLYMENYMFNALFSF